MLTIHFHIITWWCGSSWMIWTRLEHHHELHGLPTNTSLFLPERRGLFPNDCCSSFATMRSLWRLPAAALLAFGNRRRSTTLLSLFSSSPPLMFMISVSSALRAWSIVAVAVACSVSGVTPPGKGSGGEGGGDSGSIRLCHLGSSCGFRWMARRQYRRSLMRQSSAIKTQQKFSRVKYRGVVG